MSLLKSKKPIPKRRKARRGPWRSKPYRMWVASHPCLICGSVDTQAAHVVNNGTGSKGTDAATVPLCCIGADHHGQFDGRRKLPNGEVGKEAFQRFYGIDLLNTAINMHFNWLESRGGRP